MSRPGTTLTRADSRPSRSARTGIGPWFVAGITGTADQNADPRSSVRSISEYATRFGSRNGHTDPVLYDEVNQYFRDGGSEVFVARTSDTTDAVLTAALANFFPKDLGPGQVSAPGRTTAAQHVIIGAHGVATNRIPILDTSNTAVLSTLNGFGTPAGVTAIQERRMAVFTPWVVVPGVTPGSTLTIPPCGVVAAKMSQNDGLGTTPNQPSAGLLGESDTALDVAQTFIDIDRTTLNANGINVLRPMFGGVRIYGYRTLANPSSGTESNYIELSAARLLMAIEAQLDAVAERFVFRQLDGQNLTISEYGGALTAVLLPHWQRGSLYGVTPEEAFAVDVGPNVNTDTTKANGELHASVALRISPFAEEVFIELVKTRITETI